MNFSFSLLPWCQPSATANALWLLAPGFIGCKCFCVAVWAQHNEGSVGTLNGLVLLDCAAPCSNGKLSKNKQAVIRVSQMRVCDSGGHVFRLKFRIFNDIYAQTWPSDRINRLNEKCFCKRRSKKEMLCRRWSFELNINVNANKLMISNCYALRCSPS